MYFHLIFSCRVKREFRENWCRYGRAVFTSALSTLIVRFWMKFDVSNPHVVVLSICDFLANWLRKGRTFLLAVRTSAPHLQSCLQRVYFETE
jgi:hypothetical protein